MKKVLSLMLVFVLVLGMSTVAFAANPKIDKGSDKHATFAYIPNGTNTDPENIDITAQDAEAARTFKFKMDFTGVETTDGSEWQIANAASGGVTVSTMTESQRKSSKITIKTNIKKGSSTIDEVKFSDDNKEQCLTLVLKDELKTNDTDGVDFEVTSYIVVNGTHWSGTDDRVTWAGTLTNTDTSVDDDYDYIYMGDGTIVEAEAYIKEIECDLDNGVSVFAKMFNGKKYWAVSDNDPTDAQSDIMDKYGIDEVYNVRNVGLTAVANYVILNDTDIDYYVYDGDLKYLGRSGDKLPLVGTYYLAATELDDVDDVEPSDIDDPSDEIEDPVPGGGDDDYPDNANDNPGTGC